jgi:hydrogenase maturation protein HypF
LAEAARVLSSGGIVALLGIGGFHLACDATSEEAVSLLRLRKKRPGKPFAVMADSLKTAKSAGRISQAAERELAGPWAPIVLCPSRETTPIAPSVAPGQSTVGLFLPYTPLHHLLFREENSPRLLVMTSGNRSDEPLISTVEEALEKLGGVADLFLVHDRPIIHPVDDSVIKDMGSLGTVAVRRARGYSPRPVEVKGKNPGILLAVGAELMSTVTVLRDGLAFVGPHVGDLKNLETEEGFRRGVRHLLELLRAKPVLAACDLHPHYRSTAFAEEYCDKEGIPLLRIQHHEAHGAGCMAENSFNGEGVVLALDGVGFGHDGTIWGGEILTGRPGTFSRKAHLLPVHQPGGDRAALEPWRMAASHLRLIAGSSWKELPLKIFGGKTSEELATLDAMMEKGLGSPLTSSCGRLFDSAAALVLSLEGRILYSAQGPMELEAAASRSLSSRNYPEGKITFDGAKFIIDPSPLLQALLDDVLKKRDKSAMARGFHEALAKTFFKAAKSVAEKEGLKDVFLTGGCFFNSILAESLKLMLEKEGLKVHHHRRIPPGDGGISYGQASWAALRSS